MPNTDLSEGHNKTATSAGSYQFEGLRDTDVLTTTTLTNITENLLGNGVIPITQNNYHSVDRNNPISGNCCVRPNGAVGSTNQFYVDAGTVCIDGMYYTVGSGAIIDITLPANYHVDYHPGGTAGGAGGSVAPMPNGVNPSDEAILLVYVDPRAPNNVGLIYGAYVDTATSIYPSSPFAHLVRQTTVLAWLRIGKGGATTPVIHQVEDKRTFIRPGPIALSSLIHRNSATDHENPRNDMIAGLNAANLPITDMGLLYARDPTGLATPEGAAETHLFYQSDAAGLPSYQITPSHRTSTAIFAWAGPMTLSVGAAMPPVGIRHVPLSSFEPNPTLPPPYNGVIYLLEAFAFSVATPDAAHPIRLMQGGMIDTTGMPAVLSILANPAMPMFGGLAYDHIQITYTHAGIQ